MNERKFNEGPIEIPPVEDSSEHGDVAQQLIAEVTTLEDLFETIRQIGTIQGTSTSYTPEKLIGYINKIRHGALDIEYIPRTYGLRDKVKEILGKTFLRD